MTLSILICSIPERLNILRILLNKLLIQCYFFSQVEIIVFMDNKQRTIGEKRTGAMRLANGTYFAMLDDDDDCSDDYVEELLKATIYNTDIITFDQKAIVDGLGETTVNFSLTNENEEFNNGGITKRKPFPACAFKAEKFQHLDFGKTNYGEDTIFCEQAWKIAETEHHINKILHTYIFNRQITRASLD